MGESLSASTNENFTITELESFDCTQYNFVIMQLDINLNSLEFWLNKLIEIFNCGIDSLLQVNSACLIKQQALRLVINWNEFVCTSDFIWNAS